MLCDNCHSSNAAGAKFCAVCGEPLPEEALVHRQGQGVSKPSNPAYTYHDGFNGNQRDFDNRKTRDPQPNGAYGRSNNEYYGAQGGYPQQNAYPNNYAYAYRQQAPAVAQPKRRSVGAIIFYMLSGCLALGLILTTLLPNIDLLKGTRLSGGYANRFQNVYQYAVELMSNNGALSRGNDGVVTGVIILMMFMLPMIFILLWAIFSFARLSAAGGMGLTGSIILTNVSVMWILYLLNQIKLGGCYFMGGRGSTSEFLTAAPYCMLFLGVMGIVFSSVQLALRRRVR